MLEALDETPVDFVELFICDFKMLMNCSELSAFVLVLAHEVSLHMMEEVGLCHFDLRRISVLLGVWSDTLGYWAFMFKPDVDEMFQLIKAAKLVVQACILIFSLYLVFR